MLKKLLAGVITAVLSLGAVALIASPAQAWRNTVSGQVSCSADKFLVTWTIKNSEVNYSETIVESNRGAVPVPTTIGFGATATFTETVSSPQDLTLEVVGHWVWNDGKNQEKARNSASISASSFPVGCIKLTAGATSAPSVCTGPNQFSAPTYSLTPVSGVQYTVDNAPKGAGGPFPATNGTTVHIEASVTDPKYELVGTKVWDFTFTEPAGPCTVKVVPVKPILTQAICTGPGTSDQAYYTVPAITGVLFYVKVDGGSEQPLLAGKYTIPTGTNTVQVIAKGDAANFYIIDGDPVVYDVETLNPAGKCLKLVEPKSPDPTKATCDVVNNPGVVPQSTFTLFYVEHVIYEVSINGGPKVDEIINADKTISVPAGSTVVVTARVDDPTKYELTPFSWTDSFPDPGDCKWEVTPVQPTATDQFCDKIDPNNPQQIQATITIPSTPGIEYFLDGSPIAAGPQDVTPGTHTVTASVLNPATHKLDPSVTLPFTFDIKPGLCAPDFIVTPAAASSQIGCFSGGSYTLSNNLNDPNAIVWTVNGTQVAPGKYTVSNSGTVSIVAAAQAPRYGLTPGAQSTWTVNFKKPTVCDLETLALTGQSPTGLLIAADLLVVTGLALFAVRAMRRRPEMI